MSKYARNDYKSIGERTGSQIPIPRGLQPAEWEAAGKDACSGANSRKRWPFMQGDKGTETA